MKKFLLRLLHTILEILKEMPLETSSVSSLGTFKKNFHPGNFRNSSMNFFTAFFKIVFPKFLQKFKKKPMRLPRKILKETLTWIIVGSRTGFSDETPALPYQIQKTDSKIKRFWLQTIFTLVYFVYTFPQRIIG